MRMYTEGALRKKQRGNGTWVWCAIVTYTDDETGKRGQVTKVLGIECDPPTESEQASRQRGRASVPTGRGATTALKEFKLWRSSIIEAERQQALQAQIEAEEAARLASAPKEAQMTVPEYVEHYLSTKRNARTGKPLATSSRDGYRYALRLIQHPLLEMPITNVKPRDVERWLKALRKEGKGETVLSKSFRLLNQALNKAAKDELLDANPCAFLGVDEGKPIASSKSERVSTLDAPGIARLNALLDNLGHTQMADCARCALLTGMREGEICGLRWQDIDGWDTGAFSVINVRNVIQRDSRGTSNKGATKNGQWRHFEINQPMKDLLAYRFERMRDECVAAGVEFTGAQYVFGTPSSVPGEGYFSPGYLAKVWRYFAEANNVVDIRGARLTFHGLRHSFATNGLVNGIAAEDMAKFLGHSDPGITYRVYFDFIPTDKTEQVEIMGEIMSRRQGDGTGD